MSLHSVHVRHLHAVPDEALGLPEDKQKILREFVSAHLDLMVSVPDEARPNLAQKARRFGDAYSALMRGLK